jgi:hypothetical protein
VTVVGLPVTVNVPLTDALSGFGGDAPSMFCTEYV